MRRPSYNPFFGNFGKDTKDNSGFIRCQKIFVFTYQFNKSNRLSLHAISNVVCHTIRSFKISICLLRLLDTLEYIQYILKTKSFTVLNCLLYCCTKYQREQMSLVKTMQNNKSCCNSSRNLYELQKRRRRIPEIVQKTDSQSHPSHSSKFAN